MLVCICKYVICVDIINNVGFKKGGVTKIDKGMMRWFDSCMNVVWRKKYK